MNLYQKLIKIANKSIGSDKTYAPISAGTTVCGAGMQAGGSPILLPRYTVNGVREQPTFRPYTPPVVSPRQYFIGADADLVVIVGFKIGFGLYTTATTGKTGMYFTFGPALGLSAGASVSAGYGKRGIEGHSAEILVLLILLFQEIKRDEMVELLVVAQVQADPYLLHELHLSTSPLGGLKHHLDYNSMIIN